MALRQRLYDIDDLWELVCQDDTGLKHYELIDGVLIEMSPPGGRHGQLGNHTCDITFSFLLKHSI